MKKILIVIIILLLGVIFFIGVYPLIRPSKTVPVTPTYNKDNVNINLEDNLKSKGISPLTLDDLKLIFKSDVDRPDYGKFEIDNRNVYVDYKKQELSIMKPQSAKKENEFTVYKLNDYYLLTISDSTDGFKFTIYDQDIKEVFADLCEGQIAFTKEYVYYSTYECNNSQKEVHRLNLETMHSSLDFYLDHLAGWKC